MNQNKLKSPDSQNDSSEEHMPFLIELGKLVNKLVHDVRNPIGAIKGFTTLLQKDLEDQPKLHSMADNILMATESLESLVTRVLEYSRPLKLTLTNVDFVLLIKQVCKEYSEKNDENWALKVEIKPETLVFPFDMIRMKDALHHLLQNAVESMPEGGNITLALEVEGDYAVIRIEDQGAGISEEDLEQIWTPFFTTKRNAKGFGLPITKKIIKGHQGEPSKRCP